MTEPAYPLVRCSRHTGDPQPGYVVCDHVLSGFEVAHREPATEDRIGVIVCAACHARNNDQQYRREHLHCVCGHCAKEYGLLPVVN